MPHLEQRRRTTELLRRASLRRALFADAESVAWLTGFAPPRAVGPTPFLGHPGYVWYDEGRFTLLVQEGHLDRTTALNDDPDVDVTSYPGYTRDRPIAVEANAADALRTVIGGGRHATVGVERERLAWGLHRVLEETGATLEPIDGRLGPLRRVKTDEEIAALRAAFALTDVGHRAAREATSVGAREIDVWTAIQTAVERHAGRRVTLGNDCVAGEREANIGGWPGTRELHEHSSLTVDLSAVVDGYWSDSCMTYYAGGPDERQRRLHGIVADALAYGVSLLRPGMLASEVDRRLRAFMERAGQPVYPHHSGHGVGVSMHEEPRLLPYEALPLEAGMVMMLEPGIYLPGETSVRIEDAFLITDEGPERLTTHDKGC